MTTKYFFLTMMIFCSANAFAQSKTDTVKVWGVCDDCKDKIENAAKKGGAVSADWNQDNYMLVINYNPDKISPTDIEKQTVSKQLFSVADLWNIQRMKKEHQRRSTLWN